MTVKVTEAPKADERLDEATLVVVAAWATVWSIWAEVELAWFASPAYRALIGWPPAPRVEVVTEQEPVPHPLPWPEES